MTEKRLQICHGLMYWIKEEIQEYEKLMKNTIAIVELQQKLTEEYHEISKSVQNDSAKYSVFDLECICNQGTVITDMQDVCFKNKEELSKRKQKIVRIRTILNSYMESK